MEVQQTEEVTHGVHYCNKDALCDSLQLSAWVLEIVLPSFAIFDKQIVHAIQPGATKLREFVLFVSASLGD